jgi:cytochrome d ubiquinol oxidase subunit I
MSTLLAARAQMGTSLVFHIGFPVLGVGLPLLLCIAEGLAISRKDPAWMTLARRWAKAAVIIFAIGAISGTIVEFELGLLHIDGIPDPNMQKYYFSIDIPDGLHD